MQLSGRVADYTAQASRLQLLPLGAKYSFGVDFSLRLNETYLREEVTGATGVSVTSTDLSASWDGSASTHGGGLATAATAATTAALLGNDLKHVLKPQLRELKAKMARQSAEHSRQIMELADAAAAQEEAAAEHRRHIDAHGRALRAREDAVAAARGEQESSLAAASGTTDELTAQVGAARQDLAATTAATAREESIKNEQLKLNTFAAFLAHKRAEAKVTIEDCLAALSNHKAAVEAKLDALRANAQTRRDAELAMPRAALRLRAAAAAPLMAARPIAAAVAGGPGVTRTPGGTRLIAALPPPSTAPRDGSQPSASALGKQAGTIAPTASATAAAILSRRLGFEGL